jgi:hypothetical protein
MAATFALGLIPGGLIPPYEGAGSAQAATLAPLGSNDVSWLFPAPKRAADFANLIPMRDLTAPDPQNPVQRMQLWPQAAFDQFVSLASGPAGQVAGTAHRINLPPEFRTIDVWHIAAVRIDPIAPGLSPDLQAQFGQIPQIRLVVQPVTREPNGTPKVHDITAHVTYDFSAGREAPADAGCGPRPKPDMTAFREVVRDVAALRTRLAQGEFGGGAGRPGVKIATSKAPLGVHPGLKEPKTAQAVRNEMKAILERHLAGRVPGSMAIMALPSPNPEPWIFFAMALVPAEILPPNGGYIPVRGPTLDGKQIAQALSFAERREGQVLPPPRPNNLNPITCHHAALQEPLPIEGRRGEATASLFASPGTPAATVTKVVGLVADPKRSHFFNTDCISCHSETRRSMALLKTKAVVGVDPAVLPKEDWNVRNFGWFPSFLRRGAPPEATATRRTANETAAVVEFINANMLGD